MSNWISANDSFPEECKDVLVYAEWESANTRGDRQMNLKEKAVEGLRFCNDLKSPATCEGCPYIDNKWNGDDQGDCLWLMADDALKVIKAYDFALSQYKETLEELIENNDGDVKEICVFLLNLLRIKEVDIEKGFYI